MMNAITLFAYGSTATHLSGTSTKAASDLATGQLKDFAYKVVHLSCFTCGAIASSLIVGGRRKFKSGHHYSCVLSLISAIVVLAAMLHHHGQIVVWLVGFAGGAQNAMTTFFSSAIVRTTHVTGTYTDIGIELAGLILGRHKSWWKIQVLSVFAACFFFGGALGIVFAIHLGDLVLLLPATMYASMALGNEIFLRGKRANFPVKVGPSPLLTDGVSEAKVFPRSSQSNAENINHLPPIDFTRNSISGESKLILRDIDLEDNSPLPQHDENGCK